MYYFLQSKHDLKSKQDLLFLIRKVPEGVPTGDLKDAYPGIVKDLQV
jgi:transcription initiation factor TFIIE subunit beta